MIFSEYLVEDRTNYVKQKRERIENIAKELAPQFDTYESFEKAARATIGEFNPNFFDLRWGYDAYNPERIEQHRLSWEDYGRKRAEQHPDVVSPDGWTGD